MKIKIFEITGRRVAILGWSVGLSIALMLLKFFENFGEKVDVSAVDVFKVVDSATNVSPIVGAIALGIALCQVAAWEQLRYALLKANKFWLQLAQIVAMVLTLLGAVVAVMPSGTTLTASGAMMQTSFGAFQAALPFYNNLTIGVANLLLGAGLAMKFAGKVRLYGVALLVLPVLSLLAGEFYTYLYTSVGGLTLQTLETYRTMMLIFQFAVQAGLMVLLRRTMSGVGESNDEINEA